MARDPLDPYGMFERSPVGTALRPAPRRATTASGARRAARPAARTTRTPATRHQTLRPTRQPVAARRPPKHARPDPRKRLRLLLLVLALLLSAVIGRLGQLQLAGAQNLEALGLAQRTRTITLPADRGTVFDRGGHDLALSLPQQTIWADPHFVEDPVATAAALAPLLGVDPAEIEARLRGDARFVYVARQVTDGVADQVRDLALAGVNFIDEPARFNPAGSLARSVLGSVNVDGAGRAGLEMQYDDLLTGVPGELVVERAPGGRTIAQGDHETVPAVPGDDLVLTIDRGMQYTAERALAEQIVAMGAHGGTVIVSDPRTGEILAMANLVVPDEGGLPVPSSNNLALTTVFEPGSVNKVITLAAALEEGVVAPTTRLTVPDRLPVADHTFTDHDPHPVASWTPTDILATSSNIGTILLAQGLGPERVDEYLRRFGFGERTALDFPNESPGLLLPVDDWSGTSIGSIPIGQGIAVTPMQMLAAYNVLANGGVYIEPKLVLATIDAAGTRNPTPDSGSHRIVSEATANAVRDMMVAVVDAGTGQDAAIAGYSVAGKTGTARKPQAHGYQDAAGNYHYVATFAGFVPAQDPRLSVIVVIDEPSNSIFASHVAAPVFAEIASYGLREFRIPPPAAPFVSSVPAPTAAEDPIVTPVTQPTRVRAAAAPAPAPGPDPPDDVGRGP